MNTNQCKPPAVEIREGDFKAEVLESKQPVLVEFWAPWSQPCKILESVLNEIATACGGKVKIVKVNADDNPDLSLWYEVQSIPTLLYFVDGSIRAKVVGTASKEAILAKLEPFRAAL
jgi:thioredoxin 1